MTPTLTKHARRQAQRRAISHLQIAQLFTLADVANQVDRNLFALRVSHDAIREAVAEGMAPAEAERLVGRTMLLANDGSIVTLAHLHGRKASSYRRRDRRPYWKGAK